jgi:hypothetical protein
MTSEITYVGQETVFKSYSAMRNAIFNNDFATIKRNPQPPPQAREKTSKPKAVVKPVSFKEDPDTLLAIQNNSTIMHFVINCKGHKDLLAFIYIEAGDYINFVIKNPNGYPLILTRIPTDDTYIYTRAKNCVFDFPIRDMLTKRITYAKKNIYNIIYKKNDLETQLTNVQFIYELFDADNSINTSYTLQNIKISPLNVINNLFKLPRPEIKLTDETQYINGFKALNVLVLRHVVDINSLIIFNNKASGKHAFKIELTQYEMKFTSSTIRQNTAQEIATASNSIIWNTSGYNEEYLMLPFENMFKANFNKVYTYADRVYYIFGAFLGVYVLIKFISPILIKERPNSTVLNQIFDGKHQFYECYYCVSKHSN